MSGAYIKPQYSTDNTIIVTDPTVPYASIISKLFCGPLTKGSEALTASVFGEPGSCHSNRVKQSHIGAIQPPGH
ncbi:hypothetical protein EYC84_009837 [Monilinia fructicola]|uniref:Uncharacterized protein n=1 Tax=Monilinia fructicola TaxID=38448 RepID=A0A5M9JEC3_MONFR|nr:hypothetical protein EYC84_009837 [Monilinia fructicola]